MITWFFLISQQASTNRFFGNLFVSYFDIFWPLLLAPLTWEFLVLLTFLRYRIFIIILLLTLANMFLILYILSLVWSQNNSASCPSWAWFSFFFCYYNVVSGRILGTGTGAPESIVVEGSSNFSVFKRKKLLYVYFFPMQSNMISLFFFLFPMFKQEWYILSHARWMEIFMSISLLNGHCAYYLLLQNFAVLQLSNGLKLFLFFRGMSLISLSMCIIYWVAKALVRSRMWRLNPLIRTIYLRNIVLS